MVVSDDDDEYATERTRYSSNCIIYITVGIIPYDVLISLFSLAKILFLFSPSSTYSSSSALHSFRVVWIGVTCRWVLYLVRETKLFFFLSSSFEFVFVCIDTPFECQRSGSFLFVQFCFCRRRSRACCQKKNAGVDSTESFLFSLSICLLLCVCAHS